MEALFRAYITEGRDLGHTPTLLNVATAAGSTGAGLRDGCGVKRG